MALTINTSMNRVFIFLIIALLVALLLPSLLTLVFNVGVVVLLFIVGYGVYKIFKRNKNSDKH